MKKGMLVIFVVLFTVSVAYAAFGATFTKDYDYSGTFKDESYIQVNTDFANQSNPVGILDPLVIISTDFDGFNTDDGNYFTIKFWQAGNLNTPSHEEWGLYFDNDTTDSTPKSLVQLFSTSTFTDESGHLYSEWVLDIMPGSFDLSGTNWAFYVDDYSSAAYHAGIKIDEVTISNVPIPGAVWLLGSGLIGLVAVRRKRNNIS